jgi:poly-gamma-glutamate synthesis protein (capsule biosynthesis protein)
MSPGRFSRPTRSTTWSATAERAGVDMLKDLSNATADQVVERVGREKRPGDIVVASIHWGCNWGYEVPRGHIRFAHRLIDGGVDIVHGHSSHHPRPVEVYHDKLVLYGCGDFIDDYEGIPGYEEFRSDLVLMYFPVVESTTGHLVALRMVPMRIRRMRLNRASPAETEWLRDRLSRISSAFGSRVETAADGTLLVLATARTESVSGAAWGDPAAGVNVSAGVRTASAALPANSSMRRTLSG